MTMALRVLIVHNAYQQHGGEDAVVAAETELLQSRGHEVIRYGRDNREIETLSRPRLAIDTVWSARTTRDVAAQIAGFRPDVVHVHNTFPLISPSVYWAAWQAGVPVVQTLHNFRLLCPQAILLRDGRICEDCVGRQPWRGIRHGCYRGSPLQTAVLAGMLTAHRALGTWQTRVSRYIALNEFCRRKLVEGGLPAARIAIKPNFVDFPPPQETARAGFLFVGRLSAEKGIVTLAAAGRRLDDAHVIRIAGSGPEAAQLAGCASLQPLGALDGTAIRAEMCRATALVLPSICYESFPRTLVEAYACGLPVIASRLGALPDIVEDGQTGLLFAPGDADDLAAKIRWAQAHPEEMRRMGANALARYRREFSAETNYQTLLTIYAQAVEQSREDHRHDK